VTRPVNFKKPDTSR